MYFLFIILGLISALPYISSVTIKSSIDWTTVTPSPECSSRVITRSQACAATQPCGMCGVSFPLDSCQLDFIGKYYLIDNESERGYNTVFRFKAGEDTVSRVGTIARSYSNTLKPDHVLLDSRYAAATDFPTGRNIYLEIHPHYFSDLYLSIWTHVKITSKQPCPSSTDLQNTHDCGLPGRSQLFCPVYQSLSNEQMCNKCYKGTFGVMGKKQNSIAGVVELFVKMAGSPDFASKGEFYHVNTNVGKAVVSAVCKTACSADGQYFCPSEADTGCTEVADTKKTYAQAVHRYMYLREINCDNFLEIDDPICETKSNRGGVGRYKSTKVVFNIQTGKPSCDCSDAAIWNDKTQLCDLVCDSIPCTGANETPGSCKAFFNSRNFVCTCETGYTWNPTARECVASRDAPASRCTKLCPTGQQCVHWPGEPSLPQKCVCDENSTQLFEGGDCVALPDFYTGRASLI